MRTLVILTTVIVVLLVVVPLRVYSELYLVPDAVGLAALAYTCYVIYRAVRQKESYAQHIFFGNALLVTLATLDIVNTELNRFEMNSFSNFGMIVFTYLRLCDDTCS